MHRHLGLIVGCGGQRRSKGHVRWTMGRSVQGEGTSGGVQGAEGGCMGMQEIIGCKGEAWEEGAIQL